MSIDLAIYDVELVPSPTRTRVNIYVREGKIVEISTKVHEADKRIEGAGLTAIPGIIDGHVHFMDPVETEREDFIQGSSAAAVGGVTTVIEHTHGGPVRTVADLERKVEYLADRSLIDFGLAAHVWNDNLDQLPKLWEAGISFFKFFTCTTHGVPGLNNAQIFHTLETVARLDALAVAHCEDEALTEWAEEQLRTSGTQTGDVIPRWRNSEAEALAVNTATFAAEMTGANLVVAHASNTAVVDLAAERRTRGARVSVEGCPQYFYLRADEVVEHGSLRKFTPPARAQASADQDAMWAALRDRRITHISSDHAPSNRAQKSVGIWDSPFGLPGVETTLPLLLKAVNEGNLTLERVVEAVSEVPARLYGLYPRKGTIAEGADADIVLVDMAARRILSDEAIVSKAGWTPYAGMEVRGLPAVTLSRGRVVAQEGKPVGEPGWGRFLPGPGRR